MSRSLHFQREHRNVLVTKLNRLSEQLWCRSVGGHTKPPPEPVSHMVNVGSRPGRNFVVGTQVHTPRKKQNNGQFEPPLRLRSKPVKTICHMAGTCLPLSLILLIINSPLLFTCNVLRHSFLFRFIWHFSTCNWENVP